MEGNRTDVLGGRVTVRMSHSTMCRHALYVSRNYAVWLTVLYVKHFLATTEKFPSGKSVHIT